MVDAPAEQTARWLPRSMGILEPDGPGRTRIRATTDNPAWYAGRLAAVEADFRVLGSAELQQAVAALGKRLLQASGG